MLFLMFYVTLFKYWSNGPMWPQAGVEVNECKDTWWKNLLYINNLVEPQKQVMVEMALSTFIFTYNQTGFYINKTCLKFKFNSAVLELRKK